jgi:ABC-type sugar transport system substrate-binding protein
MNRIGVSIYMLAVALLAAVCMFAVNAALQPVAPPLKKVLIIGDGNLERWSQVAAGAQAAAHHFGLDVCFETPTSGNSCRDQSDLLCNVDLGPYDGVALYPVDAESQRDLVNDLAGKTKLVTIGRDCNESQRLCHVGFCQDGAGRKVAYIVREMLPIGGQVALLHSSGAANSNVRERLEGFREAWEEWNAGYSPGEAPIVDLHVDSDNVAKTVQDLAHVLQNPKIATIIAFDPLASDLVADALAQTTRSQLLKVVAFEPTSKVLDAIENGRVSFALYDDPYRQGYEAVERLSLYCRGDQSALPVPGRGSASLFGEIVDKENLASFRRRTGRLSDSARYTAVRTKESRRNLDFTIPFANTLGEMFHLPFVASVLE